MNDMGDSISSTWSDWSNAWSNTWSNWSQKWSDTMDGINNSFTTANDSLNTFLSYLNPLSDKFFLKLAFIPSDTWWDHYTSNFSGIIKTKLGFFYEVHDTIQAITDSITSKALTWGGVKIDLSHYGAGQVDIVDPTAVQQYGEKIRFWIGGLMYFLCGAWLLRKVSGILGAGKGGS